jgi:hypothetical protein
MLRNTQGLTLCQAADYLCCFLRGRGLTQGQATRCVTSAVKQNWHVQAWQVMPRASRFMHFSNMRASAPASALFFNRADGKAPDMVASRLV